jgi:hypothetical protein
MSTTVLPWLRPEAAGRDAVLAEQHGLHIGRVGQHREDHVGAFGHALGAGALRGRAVGNLRMQLAARVHEQLVAGLDQVQRHRRTHDAQADEAQLLR